METILTDLCYIKKKKFTITLRYISLLLCSALIVMIYSCKNDFSNKKYICNKMFCEKGVLVRGKREGLWKKYDKENNLRDISYYKNGELNGISVGFYKSGQPYSVGNYKKGEFNGNVSLYFDNGNLNSSDNYANGLQEGYSYLYYRNGNLKSKWFYKNNKRDGKQYYFNKFGNTVKIEIFSNGILLDSIIK